MKNIKYHTVRTVQDYNQEITETEERKAIPLTHIYITEHITDLMQAH